MIPKKLASKLKKLELNHTKLELKSKKTCSDNSKTPDPSISSGLKVKNKTIRVLLDSESSGDLLFMKKGSSKCISVVKRVVPQSWGTSHGTFVTGRVDNIEISFMEYLAIKKIHLQPDIVEYNPGDQAPMYDLTIGKQTIHNLGVKLDFQEKTIAIDEILLPMRNILNPQLNSRITRALRESTGFAQEQISTCSKTKHVVEILDAKYEKADLPAIIWENCLHLNASDREKLLSVLLRFKLLFGGTLGDWKLPPVSFELKEGVKLYHGRPYPTPHKHKSVLMKEISRLCNIGVLEWQPSSRWASPTFIIPKKDSTVHTISDFRELNKRIVRKPYPIPKISLIPQELESFTYATAFDLNMGYYTIRLDLVASEMCTIIFPWGKYSYKRLPMGFGGSAYIFQAQIMDLMASLEFVQAYMDTLLIITRGILDKHLQQMETVLTRLCDAGLKVNVPKSLFCAHEIEYLGCILTREGIKPQPKEVQVILVLNPPNNVKELRHFLGMAQYYRDMWARHSEMLAPLMGECGKMKTIRMNKTKKKPWRWDPIHQQAFDKCKGCYCKRDSPTLSGLFETL